MQTRTKNGNEEFATPNDNAKEALAADTCAIVAGLSIRLSRRLSRRLIRWLVLSFAFILSLYLLPRARIGLESAALLLARL